MTIEDSQNNNLKLCECGCGKEVVNRFVFNHHRKVKDVLKGNKHPNWKGGRYIDKGYILIWKPDHPTSNKHGYVYEHRLIMEQYLRRYLNKGEVVHHIIPIKDGGTNSIENLQLFESNGKHLKLELTNKKKRIKRNG